MVQKLALQPVSGLVLAGGQSRRMGMDKAMLCFGPETLLQRVVRIVSQAVDTTIVVAAIDQSLPALPSEVIVALDERPERGPLEGIAAGLRTSQKSSAQTDAVYITACDTPLLSPAFIQRMFELLDEQHDAAVPVLDDLPQPLAGVYRLGVLTVVGSLLAENKLRVRDLLERINVRLVPADQLRDVDPDLHSLRNLNTLDEYQAALAAAGFLDKSLSIP